MKKDHIRIDLLRVQFETIDVANRSSQPLRVAVILLETSDVILKRIERAGSDDASLPHAAAQHLAMPSRRVNQLGRTTEGGSDGSAEALTEANAHRVETLAPTGSGDAAGHHGIEEPSAIQ